MKTQTHLTNLEKKVLNFMFENKLSKTMRKQFLRLND